MTTTALSVAPHVRSGRLRGLGVTGAKRNPAMPEIPTIAEAALPGLRFCANYRGGVAMADCVKSAHATVEALQAHLGAR